MSAASFNDLHRKELCIGGVWRPPASGLSLSVVNPATEQVVGCIPAGGAQDVDSAVAVALEAFHEGTWSWAPEEHRANVLRRIGELVTQRKDKLAVLEVIDCGKPIDEADWDMEDVAGCFEYYAKQLEVRGAKGPQSVELGMPEFTGSVMKEALGVVALITPWNYPLLMASWKVAPALASGCSVILKPSELASLTCLKLAEIVMEAGVPPGVFSVLTGLGTEVGAALTSHPGVDKVAFTGSVPTGRAIMTACARDVRAVGLELGGKSPLVVFDDCDVGRAVEWAMFGCFWTNGQICSATSRLLLHESIADQFLARLKLEAEKIVVADPMERQSRMGPLVNELQYKKVLECIHQAQLEGAKLLTGGHRPPHLASGYYLQPTVFVDVEPHMAVWREEVFGPVLAVKTFSTEEQAVSLANDCEFGLGAAIITNDKERSARFVKAFRCGIVWVNCSQPCFTQMPWGGIKRSGFGRDLGENAIDNYCNVKQVCTYVSQEPFAWYPSFKQSKL